jgi:hypothetical protein
MDFDRHLAQLSKVKGTPYLGKSAFSEKREKNVAAM